MITHVKCLKSTNFTYFGVNSAMKQMEVNVTNSILRTSTSEFEGA